MHQVLQQACQQGPNIPYIAPAPYLALIALLTCPNLAMPICKRTLGNHPQNTTSHSNKYMYRHINLARHLPWQNFDFNMIIAWHYEVLSHLLQAHPPAHRPLPLGLHMELGIQTHLAECLWPNIQLALDLVFSRPPAVPFSTAAASILQNQKFNWVIVLPGSEITLFTRDVKLFLDFLAVTVNPIIPLDHVNTYIGAIPAACGETKLDWKWQPVLGLDQRTEWRREYYQVLLQAYTTFIVNTSMSLQTNGLSVSTGPPSDPMLTKRSTVL